MPQVQFWNPWFEGRRLYFDMVLPMWDQPILTSRGPWLDAAVAHLGAKPSGEARLRPARYAYVGDYQDHPNWEDRWPAVTLVDVEVDADYRNPIRDMPFADDLWIDAPMFDANADPDPRHDTLALLVFDFAAQAHCRLTKEALSSLGRGGEMSERVFNCMPFYSKLQPLRQWRLVMNAQFPDDVEMIEQRIQEGQRLGASVDWHLTYSPDNTDR